MLNGPTERRSSFPRMSDPAKALVRSHGGPGAGLALLTCPTCRLTKLDPHLFRVVLLRRLQMPLPPTVTAQRAHGQGFWANVQLAIDTTLVGALRGEESPWQECRKERGLSRVGGIRCQITSCCSWRGGRRQMVCRNVWFRGRFGEFAVYLMRKRAEWSWRLRWGSILSCAAARAASPRIKRS